MNGHRMCSLDGDDICQGNSKADLFQVSSNTLNP